MTDDIPDPDAIARHAEKAELVRIAAQRVIDDHAAGRRIDPHALQWARNITSRIKPLGRPMSTGEPKT